MRQTTSSAIPLGTDPAARENPDLLLEELARAAGRSIRSREDVNRYLQEVASRRRHGPDLAALLKVKRAMLLILLTVTFLQYYLLDSMHQTLVAPSVVFLVPSHAATQASHT